MIQGVFNALAAATVVCSAAILLVLFLRRVLRRFFGAGLAYAGWLLVPASVLMLAVPRPDSLPMHAIVISLPAVSQSAAGPAGQLVAPDFIMPLIVLVWMAGAIAILCLFAYQQHRFVLQLGVLLPTAEPGVYYGSTAGPVTLGLFNPKVVLPHDAADRYDAEELEIIVAHERVHARRGDLLANAICAGFQAAFWFNPLVHLAASCFRFDQEMACDLAVLRQFPGARRPYANAILKTQLSLQRAPLAASWHTNHPLKGRIMNINAETHSLLRNSLGKAVLGVLVVSACSGVWACADMPHVKGKVDLRARIVHDGEPERSFSLKGAELPGRPLKYTSDAGCEYEMRLAPAGELAVAVGLEVTCDGKQVAHPSLIARYDEAARVEIRDGKAQKLSISVTATKAK